MKITTTTLTLAVASAASASALVERDVATISGVIQSVGSQLGKFDTTIKAFDGTDFTALAGDATGLVTAMKDGTAKIQATDAISLQDALSLQSSLTPIQDQGNAVVMDLVAKKPEIQAAGLCEIVASQSKDFGSTAKSLIDATISKVPQQVQSVAGQLTAGFTDTLNKASDEFAPGKCVDGAPGGAVAGVTGSGLAGSNSTGTMSGGSSSSSGMPKMSGASFSSVSRVACTIGLLGVAIGLML